MSKTTSRVGDRARSSRFGAGRRRSLRLRRSSSGRVSPHPHARPGSTRCERLVYEVVNAAGARPCADCNAPRRGASPRSEPIRARARVAAPLTRPHRRHRAARSITALAAFGAVVLIGADHLQGRRRRLARDQEFGISFVWHRDLEPGHEPVRRARLHLRDRCTRPSAPLLIAGPLAIAIGALPERARADAACAASSGRWSRCWRRSRASCSGSGASSCSARSCTTSSGRS